LHRLQCLDLSGHNTITDADVRRLIDGARQLRALSIRACFVLSRTFVQQLVRSERIAQLESDADRGIFHGAQDFPTLKQGLKRLSMTFEIERYQQWREIRKALKM
jgi:hypothetical protein